MKQISKSSKWNRKITSLLLGGILALTGCGKEAGNVAPSLLPTELPDILPTQPFTTQFPEDISPTQAPTTQFPEDISPTQPLATQPPKDTSSPTQPPTTIIPPTPEAAATSPEETTLPVDDNSLAPSDLTLRIADNAGTQARGTAGQVLATGEDLVSISRNNIIFRFTDEFTRQAEERNRLLQEEDNCSESPAGRVLGVEKNVYDIELWIADECIYSGNLRDYLAYGECGFMAEYWDYDEDSPYYRVLTMMDDGGMSGDPIGYNIAAAKIHAFAKATGLEDTSEPITLTELGACRTEQEYLVDLDGDGVEECLFYGQASFMVDGRNYMDKMEYRDNPEQTCFYLWDFDQDDPYLEIAIWNLGPSNDDYLDIYHYNGKDLSYIGYLPGPATMVTSDGEGKVRAYGRLGILQTWFSYMDYQLNENGELEQIEPQLFYPDQDEEYRYTLLQPIRLYEAMDEKGAYNVLEAGVQMVFPVTDDRNFVQIKTKDGRMGYLYIADPSGIEMPEGGYYKGDVIDGLNYAD